jgi:hypothetical protein
MQKNFHKFFVFLGLDSEVLPTLLLRGWQIIAGGVMVLLIPLWLSEVEQGYYYTFASVLALQVFFELGMNQVIVQLVSHEFAHVSLAEDGLLKGDTQRISRLSALVRLLGRWYGVAATLFFITISIGGVLFFTAKGNLPLGTWIGAWILLTLGTAFNLYLSATLTILEGCGQLAGVARMRTVQSIIGYTLMCLALYSGAGLFAMPLLPLISAVVTAYWLYSNGSTLKKLRIYGTTATDKIAISWRKDIFPFQWRIAVSWVSGYFIFQLFTPLAFARLGAVEAGRLGITLTVFSSLVIVGMSWVNAKLPTFAAHVSLGERTLLNTLFKSVVKRSLAFTLIGSLCIIATVKMLSIYDANILHRFAPIPVIVSLAIVALTQCLIFSAAAYMRAHKEEPMLLNSITTAVLTLIGALIGSKYDSLMMVLIYLSINIFVGLPWTLMLLKRYYRRRV